MKISSGIFYRECGDNVYLRNVKTQKDYLLSSISVDILDYCRKHPDCTIDEICEQASNDYNVDIEIVRRDIIDFVERMLVEGVFEKQNPEASHESIQQIIENYYFESKQIYGACLEITYRCSERCKHCYVDSSCNNCIDSEINKELTLEEYKMIIDELYDLGTIYLLITGGEVCLKKEFIDIVKYAIEKGMLVNIYTNGISMTDEQFDSLCAMNINSVSFSLYGGEPSVHDHITGVPGSFNKTLNRAMMFKCAGIDTYIKSVVLKESLPYMDKLLRLGNRLNIDVSVSINLSRINGNDNPCRLTMFEEYKKASSIMGFNQSASRLGKRKSNTVFCNSGHITLSIDPYGGVHPCVAFREAAGNIREKTIREIREQSSLFKKVRNLTIADFNTDCANCDHIDYCNICIGHCFDYITGTVKPYDDICMTANAVHDMIKEKKGGIKHEKGVFST